MSATLTTPKISGIAGASRKTALDLYRTMLLIRRSQEALIEEYHPADEMRCPVHFCVGQEGPAAGTVLALEPDDYVFTGHRSHGYFLAKGGSLGGLFSELYGKSTGTNGGKAGSMELCDERVNFFSGTILSGILPIAAGTAVASQIRKDGRVVMASFGDGGADEGIVYETLNFAVLKSLPIVFICENNLYSGFSRQPSRQGHCDLAGRARAFGMPARRLDGNDALTVLRAARRAVANARSGGGPAFLELDTYRWCSHVGPEYDDHYGYRPEEELQYWKQRCPIEGLKSQLLEREILNGLKIRSIEQDVSNEIKEAFAFAKSSSFPVPDDLTTNVLSNKTDPTLPVFDLTETTFDFRQPEVVPRPY